MQGPIVLIDSSSDEEGPVPEGEGSGPARLLRLRLTAEQARVVAVTEVVAGQL